MTERQNIEWKRSWQDEYLKWICGFANAQGGSIFIGKSYDGTVCGLPNAKKLLQDIPGKAIRFEGIHRIEDPPFRGTLFPCGWESSLPPNRSRFFAIFNGKR